MKRKLLPLLIAGLTAASANVALAGAPTVYGKINVSLNSNDFEEIGGTPGRAVTEQDNWSLESNASRIGVAGDWEIAGELKAVYKLEYEVFVDEGTGGSSNREFSQRNIYGGFQGNWGTLVAGKNDSPLKNAQNKVDLFNDYFNGDIKNYLTGENRINNIVMYSTPSFSGFALTAAFAPGEDDGQPGDSNDGLADAISAAATYTNGGLYLALAMDSNVENTDIVRLVGEFTVGPVKLGALYQTAEVNDEAVSNDINKPGVADDFDDIKEQDGYVVSAAWSMTKEFVLKAQYGYSESTPVTAGLEDAEATQMAIGLDYKLDKNSMLFAYYSDISAEGDASISRDDISDATFGVGYELKF